MQAPPSQEPLRSLSCPSCQAPVGSGGGRCPYCGFALPESLGAGQHRKAALVGVGNKHLEQERARRRAKEAQKKLYIGLGVGAVAIAGAAIFIVAVVLPKPPPVPKEPPVASKEKPKPKGPPPPQKVDPTDYIRFVKKDMLKDDKSPQIKQIWVKGAVGGTVNIEPGNGSITYEFVARPKDPAAKPKDGIMLTVVVPAKSREAKAVTLPRPPVGDPICVWSHAWRAAKAAGMPNDKPVNAHYFRPKGTDTPLWEFSTGDEKTGLKRQIDARKCSIKTH